LEKARGDLRKITASDKYRLMCAVRDSGVGTDAKINWKQIVNDTFRGNYERQALVVTWGRLRKSVPDWEWKTTRDCARYLCEMYESEGNFGTAAQGEGAEAEAEDDTAVSTSKRWKKGQKVARAASTDNSAPEPQSQATASEDAAEKGNSSAAKESHRKRAKKQSKTTSDAAPPPPEAGSNTGETADEDVVMEEPASPKSQAKSAKKKSRQAEKEQSPELAGELAVEEVVEEPAPAKSHAKSFKKKSRHVRKEQSPELDIAPPEPSPSVEAQAARSRRRERRGSTVERTSAKEEVSQPTPKASSSKVSKRPRRGSLANGNMESPRAKKQKTSSSASKRKVRDEDDMPRSGGKTWSDISSDMDDMEDIPATLPTSSQAAC
jgi:hypothetical protein